MDDVCPGAGSGDGAGDGDGDGAGASDDAIKICEPDMNTAEGQQERDIH